MFPSTPQGRVVMAILIIVMLVQVPVQINLVSVCMLSMQLTHHWCTTRHTALSNVRYGLTNPTALAADFALLLNCA